MNVTTEIDTNNHNTKGVVIIYLTWVQNSREWSNFSRLRFRGVRLFPLRCMGGGGSHFIRSRFRGGRTFPRHFSSDVATSRIQQMYIFVQSIDFNFNITFSLRL